MERNAPQVDAGSANLNAVKPTEDMADRKASSPESGKRTPTNGQVSVRCFILFESSLLALPVSLQWNDQWN